MGALRLTPREEDGETVQGAMERMAGPIDQEDRMVKGGRRKALDYGEAAAHAMAYDRTYRRTNSNAMLGAIPEAAR